MVEEIEHEGSQTQTVCIFHERGDEVMVMEEVDTTKEVKRLRPAISIVMKQIEVRIASAMPSLALENMALYNLGAL